MKKALLSLLLIAGWLACFPAYATTYTYNVDYSFTTTPGQVTGSIVSSCDSCVLTASNVLSWSFTASDGTSGSSSGPTAGINASGTHSPSDANGNLDGYEPDHRRIFRILQRHIEQRIGLLQHSGAECRQCFPLSATTVSDLAYQLGGEFVCGGNFLDGQRASGWIFPSIEIASLAAAPELPVWGMMIAGFAGCGFVALRARRHETKLRSA